MSLFIWLGGMLILGLSIQLANSFLIPQKKGKKNIKNTTCRIFVLEVPESLLESVKRKNGLIDFMAKGLHYS